uniref:Uncharacterized protein n=1 Tax=Suricata suricatta TaxID=37032 RepID=A0A673UFP4_SURSU
MDCTTWSHLWNGGLPLMRSGLELTEVPAVQQKRMVAFLNQSEVHTTTFLHDGNTIFKMILEEPTSS